MRRISLRALWPMILLGLMALPPAAKGETRQMAFDVSLLGLPVGRMQFAAEERGGAYAVSSSFAASGIGALARAGFALSAQGRIRDGALRPLRYDERIDTGRRSSTAQIRYRGGVPRLTGGSVKTEAAADPTALDPAGQGGTVDPLTGLYAAIRDQPRTALCRLDVVIFDGQRRSGISMTGRSDSGDTVTCTGAYTRLAGFSASEMKRQTVYPFTVTYAPGADMMQATAVTVRSSYGQAAMVRR